MCDKVLDNIDAICC